MSKHVASEAPFDFGPLSFLPSQLPVRGLTESGEHKLWAAIMQQAIDDVRYADVRFARGAPELAVNAHDWALDPTGGFPFVCELLDLDVGRTRSLFESAMARVLAAMNARMNSRARGRTWRKAARKNRRKRYGSDARY